MKYFKRIMAIVLSLAILVGGIPLPSLPAFAEDDVECEEASKSEQTEAVTESSNDLLQNCVSTQNVINSKAVETASNEVYYSDLFYGYDTSYLLDNNVVLKTHASETSNILADIYNDYADSDKFLWTNIKSSLAAATDIKEWVGLIESASGSTDYIYAKALDKANQEFAKELLGKNTVSETIGTGEKIVNGIKKVMEAYDEFEENFDVYNMTEYEIYRAFFEILKNNAIYIYIDRTKITTIEEKILPDITKYTDMISITGDALKAAQTIAIGLMLEDIRMGIIEDILVSVPKDSVLYEGMSRLKSQLNNGFVSYFWANYVEDELLKKFGEIIVEKIISTPSMEAVAWYKVITAGIDLASMVVFDVIFDVPGIDDMTTQKVLASYADDLYVLLKERVSLFNTQFESGDIGNFEAVFNAYLAATNAALEVSEKLTLNSNQDDLSRISNAWKTFSYTEYIEDIIRTLELTDVSKRITKNFGTWNYITTSTLRQASNKIENNSIYFFNGVLNADLVITNRATLVIPEGCEYTIDGDIEVGASWIGSYDFSGDDFGYLKNWGTLTCTGNLDVKKCSYNSFASQLIQSEQSKLNIGGNLYLNADHGLVGGTIVFNGTEQQAVENFKGTNVEVQNPAGIKYFNPFVISGEYNLNGNPLDNGDYYTIVLDGASFKGDYDYKKIVISKYYINASQQYETFTLRSNIKGTIYITNGATLIVPEGCEYTIDGDIEVGAGKVGSVYFDTNHGCLENLGTLICTGDVSVYKYTNSMTSQLLQTEQSKLIVAGDFYLNVEHKLIGGTIVFNGTEQQAVENFEGTNVEVQNPAGIKYLSPFVISGEYNLNGNPLDNGDYYTIVLDGASFKGDYDYKKIVISKYYINASQQYETFTLRSNIKGTIYITNGATLIVPEGCEYTIDGDIEVGAGKVGSVRFDNNRGRLENLGTLICTGEVNVYKYTNSMSSQLLQTEQSKLIIAGDLYLNTDHGLVGGTIVFNGTEQQCVTSRKVSTIILENTSQEGVVFTSTISPSVLFDHKRNNFTLYNNGSGSVFVDYDGDGLKDNEDPYPTIWGDKPLIGDVNGDEVIDARDITLLRRYYVGWDVTIDETAADVNADRVIDARDITLLRRYYVGWDVELG